MRYDIKKQFTNYIFTTMKNKLSILIILLFLLSACNDWLDVQPEASISQEELFRTEEGFFEALNGVYTQCSDNYLYGGLFTVEIQDAFAQNYSYRVQDYTNYLYTSLFDFSNQTFKWRNSLIWTNAYKAIVNINLILENIDEKKDIFHEGMYELVKGEALALRAYIHFDLLRYFSLPYNSDSQEKTIPYVTSYSNRVTPLSTGKEVTDMVLEDLNIAEQLLSAVDPILSGSYVVGYNTDRREDSNEQEAELFLQNRRHRINYYAVCGTLARVYLYVKDYNKAFLNADKVISAAKFPWVNPDIFLAEEKTRDRLMYPELIFAWYIEQLEVQMRNRYENVTTGYFINNDHARNIYEVATVGAEDYRFKGWFLQATAETSYQLVKYLRNRQEDGNRHYLVAPALRLSEMYYIVAESIYGTNPALAWQYLNEVRFHRGIDTPLDGSYNFTNELLKEYRKETYGEGQAFYSYKRLGQNIYSETGIHFLPSDIAPIPLPDDEIEFGNR